METKEPTELSSSRSNNNNNDNNNKKMKGVFHHNWRDWAGLPMHLLFEIVDRVTVGNYFRFGAVCKSWRSIFLEENISNTKKHWSQPFLLIRSPDNDDDRMVLYSLNNREIYNFDLQLAADTTYCRGLTSGWLLTSSESKDNANNLRVQLRNPFLSGVIHLPDIGKLLLDRKNFGEIESSVYIWKAALSCDPRSSTEFRVAAIVSSIYSLAVFDSKRTYWAGDEKLSYFDDVIFFTKTKQFYVLRSSRRYRGYNNNGEVLAIHDIDDCGRPKLVPVVPPLTDKNCRRNNNYPLKSYLVDDVSSGELLLVHRWENIKPKWTFGVFKLDRVNNTWIRTDLSGKVLFVGLNTSVVRFARDCPGCRPNSIYFTQDDTFLLCRRPYGLYEDGVYSLETRSLHRHYTTKGRRSKKPTPPAIWIEPTLPRTLLSEE